MFIRFLEETSAWRNCFDFILPLLEQDKIDYVFKAHFEPVFIREVLCISKTDSKKIRTILQNQLHMTFYPLGKGCGLTTLWTIHYATTILEKRRKVVLEKWFCKLVFFWSTTFLQPENARFIVWNHLFFWSTTILEPDFPNQISQTKFLKPDF